MQNNNLTLIAIIIFGLFAGYVYYVNAPSEIIIDQSLSGRTDDLKALENIGINFSSLDVNKINDLSVFGEYPVDPGVTGKRNIFAPF